MTLRTGGDDKEDPLTCVAIAAGKKDASGLPSVYIYLPRFLSGLGP